MNIKFDINKDKASFEKNVAEPNISVYDHLRRLRIELGMSLYEKKKIYRFPKSTQGTS